MSVEKLTDLVDNTISDRLIAAPGVADVQVYGDRVPIFRIDVDQTALASRGLTLGDVADALDNADFDSPAGSLTASNQSLVVRTTATVNTPEAFGALMLDPQTRLSDVATITLGPDSGSSILRSNGQTGLGIGIIRQAQSNTLEISRSIHAIVEDIAKTLPPGVSIFITGDDAVFITGSIREVLRTLALSIAIVVAIIYLFLRDWRATLIPALTIPVALVGTLAAVYMMGFSVNILTLLALVLATGLVVDDAIVVLENIVRRRGQGMGPRAAAVLGTQQVFFAVVATTATLAAVFVPLSFLPGQTGALFREFGITLALAVTISSLVALSLCPMMASRLLRGGEEHTGHDGPHRPGRRGAGGDLPPPAPCRARRAAGHPRLGARLRRHRAPHVLGDPPRGHAAGGPRGGAPADQRAAGREPRLHRRQDARDRGRTEALRASGEVIGLFSIAGSGGSDNSGFMIFTLAPWDERARGQAEIVGDIDRAARAVVGVQAYALQPNSLGIRGAGQGLQLRRRRQQFRCARHRGPGAGGEDGGRPRLRAGAHLV